MSQLEALNLATLTDYSLHDQTKADLK